MAIGNFYKLQSYYHQTYYLQPCIKKVELTRRLCHTKHTFSTQILKNKRVCREFFLKSFDITNRRFTTMCQKTNNLQMCGPEQQGKGPSKRKLCEETRQSVIEYIKKFLKYASHYSRQANPDGKYLSPDLTLKKMDDLYKADCEIQNFIPLKWFLFNTKFDLRFHRPSETCSRCDSYQQQI